MSFLDRFLRRGVAPQPQPRPTPMPAGHPGSIAEAMSLVKRDTSIAGSRSDGENEFRSAGQDERGRSANHSATPFKHGSESPYPDGYDARSANLQSGAPDWVGQCSKLFGGAAPMNIRALGAAVGQPTTAPGRVDTAQRVQARAEETD